MAGVAGNVAGNTQNSWQFSVVSGYLWLKIPPSTLRFDLNNRYRVEEDEERKILGLVSWPTVAGRPRYGRSNGSCYSEGRGERESRLGWVSRNGNPNSPILLFIVSFFPTSADHNFLIRTPI